MAKKDKDDKGHKTKAFKKAKDRKEDIKFMETVHEKKFGDRPKMKKDSPHSTVAGYLSTEQRKHGTKQSKTTTVKQMLTSDECIQGRDFVSLLDSLENAVCIQKISSIISYSIHPIPSTSYT